MKYFLAKTDPETYSIADLAREKKTVWDGITHPQALRAIGEMRRGDLVFIYHSGGRSEVVGLARVVAEPRPDSAHAKRVVVDFEFLFRLDPPMPLGEIKACGLFADWALVRQGRLSTMAAPDRFAAWMRERYPKLKI